MLKNSCLKHTISITKFIEIYIKCSVETCMQRDPKGYYKKAISGEITTLPLLIEGVNDDFVKQNFPFFDIYEPPLNADLTIDTDTLTLKESTDFVIEYLRTRNILT